MADSCPARPLSATSSALWDGVGDMHAAILLGAGHGKKQIARTHLAAVQGQFADQRRTGGFRQQLIEGHGHQIRPPLRGSTAAVSTFAGSAGGRVSGATFIRRSAPAMTLPNTGAETRPP